MKVTQFYINGDKALKTWIFQNHADLIESIDGCLLDNYVVQTKNGYAAIYEHPCTEWSSNYRVEFQRGNADDVWSRWNEFSRERNGNEIN